MIGFIKGTIEEIEDGALLVDRDGIGFRIFVPSNMTDGSVRTGEQVRLYTHLHVKEDALTLYGFFSRDELEIFRMLTGVSGIGPKGALAILSTLGADDLRFAVLSDDVAYIQKAPGIGKKTAQKLILELRDKFRLDEAFEKKLAHTEAELGRAASDSASARIETDAVEALVALGYSGTEALQAVRRVEGREEMSSEEILKAALAKLF